MENEQKKKGVLPFLVDTLKGVTLGISVAVPGLSAGTIAIAERCYDTLITSITSLRKQFKINFLILLPYVLGLLVGAIAALVGIQRGYNEAPFTLTGLFAGCIVGSLPVALSELRKPSEAKGWVSRILAFALCLLVAGGLGVMTIILKIDWAEALEAREWWIYLFVILGGFVAAAACIVPGISGSMSLMVLGLYYPILNSYTGENAIWHSGDTGFILTGLVIALLLVIGALIGLVVSSKVMKKLLSDHREVTFYGIFGLILGSLVSMFFNYNIFPQYDGLIDTWDYILGGVLFVIAAIGVFFLVRYSNKKNQEN